MDGTDPKPAEAALREDAESFRALFRSNLLPIFYWHEDGRILDANEAYLRLVGAGRANLEAGHLGWGDLTDLAHLKLSAETMAELAAGGRSAERWETEYRCTDGRRINVLVTGSVSPGQSERGVASVVDVTARDRPLSPLGDAENEAQRLRNELFHVTRVSILGELVASLAHELNQPLTAILSNAQTGLRLRQNDRGRSAELREILEDVAIDARRAGEIIRRVRQLTRKGQSVYQLIDMNELISEVRGLLKSDSLIRQMPIECALAPGLPPVHGDRIQLEQVLLNLMVNGLESMRGLSQRDNLRLEISSRRTSDGSITVALKDRGIGVALENLEDIFKPFFSTKPDGMGMGLWICRSVVAAHDGRISASNNIDGGATFEVELPIAKGLRQ